MADDENIVEIGVGGGVCILFTEDGMIFQELDISDEVNMDEHEVIVYNSVLPEYSTPNLQVETICEPISSAYSPLEVSTADESVPPVSSDYNSIIPKVATDNGLVSPVCSMSIPQVPTASDVPESTDIKQKAGDRDMRLSTYVEKNLSYEVNDNKDGPPYQFKSFDEFPKHLDRSEQGDAMGGKSYTCYSCGFRAFRLKTLRLHMVIHVGRQMRNSNEHGSRRETFVEEIIPPHQSDDNHAGQKSELKSCGESVQQIEDPSEPENDPLDEKTFSCCDYKAQRLHMKTHIVDERFLGNGIQLGHLSGHKWTRNGEKLCASDKLNSGTRELVHRKYHLRSHVRKCHSGIGYQHSATDECDSKAGMFTRSRNKANLVHQNSYCEEKPYQAVTQPEEKACVIKAGISKSSKRRKIQSKKSFQLKISLRTHGNKSYPCCSCSYKAGTQRDLEKHEMIHTGEKPYCCSICSYRGRQLSHLADHMRTHSSEKPFGCRFCDFKTKYQPYLRYHMRIHSGDMPFTCYYCGYKARFRDRITKHMTIHAADKQYACDQCDFRTRQGWYLKNHKKTHSAEKPLKCAHCGFRTKRKESLKKHLKIHTGERPYSCDFCDFKARFRENLTVHERTHTGQKPYPCPSCRYRGRISTHLKLHMKNHHPEEMWPVCYDD